MKINKTLKKHIALLLSCAAVILCAACERSSALHVYEYSGWNDDTATFHYTGDVWKEETREDMVNADAVQTRRFSFLGTGYELAYVETFTKEFLPYAEERYYPAQAGSDLEFSFKEGTDLLTGVFCYDGLTIRADLPQQTEEAMKSLADSVVKEYIIPEEYTCSCSSEVIRFKEQNGIAESDREAFDYFYQIQEPGETALYTFTYNKIYQGYRTCEMAVITLTENGLLYNLQLNAIGMFSSEASKSADNALLQDAVSKKLSDLCKEGYTIRDAQNSVTLCKDPSGRLFYVVVALPTVAKANSTALSQELCLLIVSEKE